MVNYMLQGKTCVHVAIAKDTTRHKTRVVSYVLQGMTSVIRSELNNLRHGAFKECCFVAEATHLATRIFLASFLDIPSAMSIGEVTPRTPSLSPPSGSVTVCTTGNLGYSWPGERYPESLSIFARLGSNCQC